MNIISSEAYAGSSDSAASLNNDNNSSILEPSDNSSDDEVDLLLAQTGPLRAEEATSKETVSVVREFLDDRKVDVCTLTFCKVQGREKKSGYKCGATTGPLIQHIKETHKHICIVIWV